MFLVSLFCLFLSGTQKPLQQALHNSHSTLDRTCSDSVVSLKHRKSTSDLTHDDDSFRKENGNVTPTNAPQKHRRRGSSKGGLAYLVEKRDSRRGSRESVISQQTNVSNEDIGPLTNFQQTQRGRQRRTSNFLELPGETLRGPTVINESEGKLISLQSPTTSAHASVRYRIARSPPTTLVSAKTFTDCERSQSARAPS